MIRKGSVVLLVILFIGLSILVFSIARGGMNIFTDLYKAIPTDAIFISETSDLPELLNELIEGNGLFSEFASFKELEKTCNSISLLRDYLNKEEIRSVFDGNKTVISFHETASGLIRPLMVLSRPSSVGNNHIRDILRTVSGGKAIEARSGRSLKIAIPFNISGMADTMQVEFSSGLIMCSTSSVLLKDAMEQKNRDTDIREVSGFTKILAASGTNEDKIFVVFRNLTALLYRITGGKVPDLVNAAADLAGSAEGDIYIDENGFTFSGYTESSDSSDLLYKYKSLAPGQLVTYKVLPSSTLMFETRLLPPVSINLLKAGGDSDFSSLSLAEKIRPFLGEEITTALIDNKENGPEQNFLVIYKLANRNMAEQAVLEELEKWNLREGNEPQGFIRLFQPDDITRIPVYSTPFKDLSSVFINKTVAREGDSLMAFYDDFLITGSSFSSISRFLYDNLLNNTFANSLEYRDFEDRMPSRAGYFFYCVPSAILNYLSGFLRDDILRFLNQNISSVKKIQALGYQFASSNNMLYNTLTIKYKEKIREETGTEWATLLDTAASIKPFFFTNHNTGAREIFIQDFKNKVYLVNAAGRVLWKIQLNERIRSEIYMIDYYRNGKYQILFSGKNYLHLLDRNGNYVERYPVRLRSPASGPMALFDYDNNGDYRIVVPGEDKLIYVYDKTGSVVRGWNQFKTSGPVKTGVMFFRVSGKDYLVVSDDKSVYFLDRTGNIRLKLKEPVSRAVHSEMRLNQGTDPYLVFSDPDGIIQNVSFDGNVSKTKVRRFSVDHSFDFFDVDGDSFGEYIFIDSGKLYLYDHDKSETFIRDFGTVELGGPIIFTFSVSDKKIGVFNNKEKLIYLIDRRGNSVNGFPLRGASMFSIGRLSDKSGYQLIVGSSDNFLYNYRLNMDN